MFKTIINAFKIKEVRNKILLTVLFLFIYRLGCWLPLPGVAGILSEGVNDNGFLSLLSSVSGGALANGAFLALGVSPYISAQIIMQLLTVAFPALKRVAENGEEGRKKMGLYTRIAALVLATAQAIGITVAFGSAGIDTGIGIPTWITCSILTVVLVAGSMFTVWIGERITELGIGNGLSLLIFVGLLSTASASILQSFQNITQIENIWSIIIFALCVILIFGLIVFIDGCERRVEVKYAKQMRGRKMYGGQSSYIPIRVSGAGVLPIIFASTLLVMPQMLISIFDPQATSGFAQWWATWLGSGTIIYTILTALLILGFAYFWSQITFNPEDVSKQIQQNGGFIQGVRPGTPTRDHLKKISNRITLFGAIYLACIALIPSIVFTSIGFDTALVNAFSATGLMIIVSVALETDKQLQAQMITRNYRGFLK